MAVDLETYFTDPMQLATVLHCCLTWYQAFFWTATTKQEGVGYEKPAKICSNMRGRLLAAWAVCTREAAYSTRMPQAQWKLMALL